MTHYVILGSSAAGLSAIDAIRDRDRDGQITVITKEDAPAYSRVALPYVLSREKNLEQITLHHPGYFEEKRVDIRWGIGASSVNTSGQTVRLDDGSSVSYDRLLLATGSASRVPRVRGIENADVCYHWTLADTRKLQSHIADARSCFVIGAGFISLLTVSALIKVARLDYTVVEMTDQVMPQLLDGPGGSALQRAMKERGISVTLEDSVEAIERGSRGYQIKLGSGATCEADMIICGAGVRPNVDFLADSGIDTDRGVLVNAHQQTNTPNVYAAGDCAEGLDFLSGERCVHAIWPTAIDQGRVAGANMAGGDEAYPGSLSWNVTELFGITMASVGEFRDRPGLEPIVFHNPQSNVYRKLLLDGGLIRGCVVIGSAHHVQDLGVVQAMIRRRTDVSRWKHMLASERINYGMIAYETVKK